MMKEVDCSLAARLPEGRDIGLELLLSSMPDSRDELARFLNVSPSSIFYWIYTGGRIDSSH